MDSLTQLALGAAGVIRKPFDPMQLPAQISAIFEDAAAVAADGARILERDQAG